MERFVARMTGGAPLRALSALTLSLLVVILGATGAPLAHAAKAVTVQAEALAGASSATQVVRRPSAGGGAAVSFTDRGDVSASVRTPEAARVIVRARGRWCASAPRLRLAVDGRRVMSQPLTRRGWDYYARPVRLAAGRHAVTVGLANRGRTRACHRSMTVDSIRFIPSRPSAPTRRPPAPAPGSPVEDAPRTTPGASRDVTVGGAALSANTLFASSYENGFSEYRHQINPERIDVVDDPVLGRARKVLKFEVHQSDTGPTENPRAQIETPYDFTEGADRYFGFSLYFPASFPSQLPPQGWVTVGAQAYGPPYDGAAGTSLRVQNAPGGGGAEIRWQRNDSYAWDIPWRGPRIDQVRGRWVDLVQRIKLHRDPRVGFVEMWMNTGDGWRQQKLSGQDRLYMSTYDSANGGGANNSRLALYYRKDIPGPLTLFHGPHRIAAAAEGAFAAVAPTSYGD